MKPTDIDEINGEILSELPSIPQDLDGPVFQAPWEARVFSMTLALHQQGLFTWTEWTNCLGDAISTANRKGDAGQGNTYYQHWLDALEIMLVEKQLSTPQELKTTRQKWELAAQATPHGQPIDPEFP